MVAVEVSARIVLRACEASSLGGQACLSFDGVKHYNFGPPADQLPDRSEVVWEPSTARWRALR